MYTFSMKAQERRRPRPVLFMAAAAYLTIAAVAASIVLRATSSGGVDTLTVVVTALVVLFGVTIPAGARPWLKRSRFQELAIAFDTVLLVILLFTASDPWLPAVLFFVLIPVSSRLRPLLRYSVYAAAPLIMFAAVAIRGHLDREWGSLASMVPGFIAVMVFSESYRAVRESSQESRKLLDELVKTQGQLREVAVLEERQRLAQEMHDAVGHRLTVASIQLEAVGRLIPIDPQRAIELAATSRVQVREGLAELRAAVGSLKKPEIDPRALRLQIEETIRAFHAASSIEVEAELDPAADTLDAKQAIVLLRSVQEGLTNVQRHSRATHVKLSLGVHRGEGRIDLRLEDNGEVLPEAAPAEASAPGGSGGFGLRSLRERAEAVGGSLQFARDDSGARLIVVLPTSVS